MVTIKKIAIKDLKEPDMQVGVYLCRYQANDVFVSRIRFTSSGFDRFGGCLYVDSGKEAIPVDELDEMYEIKFDFV